MLPCAELLDEDEILKKRLLEGDIHDVKTLISSRESHKLWNLLYERLKNRSVSSVSNATFEAARDVHNRWKNRYRDIIPYDSTRVMLNSGSVGNYINASYVQVAVAPSRRYILTQGPMQQTASHFWLMVWERRSPAIVMLNRILEKGIVKCHPYFPRKRFHPTLNFDDVNLCVKLNMEATHGHFVERILCLLNTRTGEQHDVLHLHFTNWPDFGVPFSPSSLLDFLWAVRNSGALDDPKCPAVIHCSAGVGRSGAFILIDLALHLVEMLGNIRGTDLDELFVELRRCRMGIIQTSEQLRFCYHAIAQGTEAILSVPPEEIPSIRFSQDTLEINGSNSDTAESWDGMMENQEDDSSSEDFDKMEVDQEGFLGPSGEIVDTKVRLLSRLDGFHRLSPMHCSDDGTLSNLDVSPTVLPFRYATWVSSSWPTNTCDDVIAQARSGCFISTAVTTDSSFHPIVSGCGPIDKDLPNTPYPHLYCPPAGILDCSHNRFSMSAEQNSPGSLDNPKNLVSRVAQQDVSDVAHATEVSGLEDEAERIEDMNEAVTDPLTTEYLAASLDLKERHRARRLRRERIRKSIEAIRERVLSENLERKRLLPLSLSYYMRRFFAESGYVQSPLGAFVGASLILALTVSVTVAIYSYWVRR